MTFFDKLMDGLFPKKPQSNKVLVHENIKRTPAEQAAYTLWRSNGEASACMEELFRSWNFTKLDIRSNWLIHLHASPYSNGFALDYPNTLGPENFRHLFDYLKELVLRLPYRPSGSDRRILQQPQYLEVREMHYLKPQPGNDPNIANQRYGNILIEMVQYDDKPQFIKFMANVYQDRLFTQAGQFEDLMHTLSEMIQREN